MSEEIPVVVDQNNHFVMLQDRILSRLTVSDVAVDRVAELYPIPATANSKQIPFMTERIGDFNNELEQAIGSLGIVAIVMTPTGEMFESDSVGLEMKVPVIIHIEEDVLINRAEGGTKVSASSLAIFCMRRLQDFSHGLYDGDPDTMRIRLAKRAFLLLKRSGPTRYSVAAHAPIDLSARLPDEYDELLFDDGTVVQYA